MCVRERESDTERDHLFHQNCYVFLKFIHKQLAASTSRSKQIKTISQILRRTKSKNKSEVFYFSPSALALKVIGL